MSTLNQTSAAIAMALKDLPTRLGTAAVAAVGIAGVVTVLIGVLSMSAGFRSVAKFSGRDDVAIVLRGGSNDEMSSGFGVDQVRVVDSMPGVARDAAGPITSAELYVIVDLPMKSTGTASNVPFRGVSNRSAQLRRGFHLVAGRMYTPGKFEVIVGQKAARQFGGVELNHTARWGSTDWQIVGVFADAGSVAEGELWTDSAVLQGVYHRGTSYQSVRAQLTSASAMPAFSKALEADPRLQAKVRSEREFYADQSRVLTLLVDRVGMALGILMGLGAVFAALNTMYSAVAARTREIATLRALGFGPVPVVASVVVESLVLGLAGGLVGAALAWVAFNGIEASTLNFQSFSQLSFSFAVTPALIVTGIVYALLLALVGGLLPAIRAANQPVVAGLRAL